MNTVIYTRLSSVEQTNGSRTCQWLSKRRQRLLAEIRLIESIQKSHSRHPRRAGFLSLARLEEMFWETVRMKLLKFREENQDNGSLRDLTVTPNKQR